MYRIRREVDSYKNREVYTIQRRVFGIWWTIGGDSWCTYAKHIRYYDNLENARAVVRNMIHEKKKKRARKITCEVVEVFSESDTSKVK